MDDLLDHAIKIARFGLYTGKLNKSKLFTALAAVIDLQPGQRKLSAQQIGDLKGEVDVLLAEHKLRDTSFSSMSARWDPANSIRKSWPFVVGAILLMYIAGALTTVYSSGDHLIRELQSLDDREVVDQFGQLELKIYLANKSISSEIKADGDDKNGSQNLNIARALVYSDIYRLRSMNREISLSEARFAAMQLKAQSPFPNTYNLASYVANSARFISSSFLCFERLEKLGVCNPRQVSEKGDQLIITDAYGYAGAALPAAPNQPTVTLPQLCDRLTRRSSASDGVLNFFGRLAQMRTGTSEFDRKLDEHLDGSYNADLRAAEIVGQNCGLTLSYYSATMPNLKGMRNEIADAIAPYANIYIPAIFGALGSLMYFMRNVLNPLRINPNFWEVLFRVALGGLAGVLVVWLWNGVWQSQQVLAFGVFALAFVAGFSERVFFEFLDRLVRMASDAVSGFGKQASSGGSDAARTPQQPEPAQGKAKPAEAPSSERSSEESESAAVEPDQPASSRSEVTSPQSEANKQVTPPAAPPTEAAANDQKPQKPTQGDVSQPGEPAKTAPRSRRAR